MVASVLEAARTGNLDELRHALDNRVDVNHCLTKDERAISYSSAINGSFYSALTVAVRYSQIDAARLLLEHGADVHLRPWDSEEDEPPSAIEMAADIADIEMLALLVEHDELAPWPPFGEETLLARIVNSPPHGCSEKHREAAQFLIDRGYTVHILSRVLKEGSLIEAVRLKAGVSWDLDPLEKFLAKGHFYKPSEYMPTAASAQRIEFFRAAIKGDLGILQDIIQQGVDVNALPTVQEEEAFGHHNERCSALARTAGHGHSACVKLLLDHGADMHRTLGDYCPTALQEAAECGVPEILKMLIDYDPVPGHAMSGQDTRSPEVSPLITLARTQARTREGQVFPEHVAAFRLLLSSGFSPDVECENSMTVMQYATQNPDPIFMKVLVDEFGANVDFPQDDGTTALLALCRSSVDYALERMDYLLAHGADLFKLDNEGCSALHYVTPCGSPTVTKALLEKADWTTVTLAPSHPLPTIVHAAAVGLNVAMLQMLLDAGFDVNAIDPKSGETPLQAVISKHGRRFARSYKHRALQDRVLEYDATVALLKKHGAMDHAYNVDPRL